ncbi:MAG: carboxypeptidase-like regulatory domain-containing protein, partial [Hymenobacter sp.]
AAHSSRAPAGLAARQTGSLNPAPGRGTATMRRSVAVADVSGVRTVRGVVLDQRRRAPVPYASVQLVGQGQGTVADAQGRFELALPGPTELQISSLGYEVAKVQSPRGSEELTVLLAPASYALEEVRVASARPLSAADILQRVVKRIPQNYEQQDYTTEAYTYRRFSSFDTLRAEIETVNRVRVPAGYRHFTHGFLGQEEGVTIQPEQRHVLTERGGPLTIASMPALYTGTQGSAFSAADPVRTSPLFGRRSARRFVLKLDSVRRQGADTLYVLSFAVRHGDHRSTGTYLMSGYQGRLLVRARDYAVLRYEALWQTDTAAVNANARKSYSRSNGLASHYPHVFTADRTTHVVDYAKAANGRYYVRRSVGQTLNAGRTLGRGPFYSQSLTEHYFRLLPEAGAAPAPAPKEKGKAPTAPAPAPYRPEFWAGYQRPGGPLAGAASVSGSPVAQP